MVKNIKFNSYTTAITKERLEIFNISDNKKMLAILKCIERMIQEYTGIILSDAEIEFESDNKNEFPFYPIIEIKEQKENDQNNLFSTKYTCGLQDNIEYYLVIIIYLAKRIYYTEQLPTLDEIKKYTQWMPSKHLYAS